MIKNARSKKESHPHFLKNMVVCLYIIQPKNVRQNLKTPDWLLTQWSKKPKTWTKLGKNLEKSQQKHPEIKKKEIVKNLEI